MANANTIDLTGQMLDYTSFNSLYATVTIQTLRDARTEIPFSVSELEVNRPYRGEDF